MLKNDGSFNSEGSASLALVSAIRNLGVEVPSAVDDEVQLYRDLRQARETAQRDYDAAVTNLIVVSAKDFVKAKTEVIDSSTRLKAITQGVDQVLVDAAARRLANRLFDATPAWEATIVERFNEAVRFYELNEVAGDLPNFADPGSFNVMSLGSRQGHAVDRWRTSLELLNPLWVAYGKLAAFHGYLPIATLPPTCSPLAYWATPGLSAGHRLRRSGSQHSISAATLSRDMRRSPRLWSPHSWATTCT